MLGPFGSRSFYPVGWTIVFIRQIITGEASKRNYSIASGALNSDTRRSISENHPMDAIEKYRESPGRIVHRSTPPPPPLTIDYSLAVPVGR